MIHARSVRLATVIVLGGAVALATSACGGPMQAGAAAVIDGQRVTDATIQDQVASIVSLDQKYAGAQGDVTDAGRTEFAQWQLKLLVQQALWQKAAQYEGVTVSAADDSQQYSKLVESARQFYASQNNNTKFPGSDNEAVAYYAAAAPSQQGQSPIYVAPSNVGVYTHLGALGNAVQNAVIKNNKIDVNDPNANQEYQVALTAVLSKAAKSIDYKLSPRYGTFDPATATFVSSPNSWIRLTQAQQTAAAAAQPQ